MNNILETKIKCHKAKIGIIGLGYVGLPLAVAFAKEGFKTIGIDINKEKIKAINRGSSYVGDVESAQLNLLVKNKMLQATSQYKRLKDIDVVIICVPTPLSKTKQPDTSYILNAVSEIARYVGKLKLVILESTSYPGTTEELILPRLEEHGLKVGKDFYLAFSPERIDPANKNYKTANIPKVVGGITSSSGRIAKLLYGQIVKEVIPVSSAKVAEMVKLLENTFRAVNIGLINEVCLMCDRLHIDVWEVIEAAKTKPFGFMAFYPGPGIGGECIPADPVYLSWKARAVGFEARLIELAEQINSYMPQYVAEKIDRALNSCRKSIKASRILIIGAAYKANVSDTRDSPALAVIKLLKEKGARVRYYDPFVDKIQIENDIFKSIRLSTANISSQDCVCIITDHSGIDYNKILKYAKLIIDTRNTIKNKNKRKVIKL